MVYFPCIFGVSRKSYDLLIVMWQESICIHIITKSPTSAYFWEQIVIFDFFYNFQI